MRHNPFLNEVEREITQTVSLKAFYLQAMSCYFIVHLNSLYRANLIKSVL